MLARAREQGLSWEKEQQMSSRQVTEALFPSTQTGPAYKMPDYEWVHREMQKSGVTLSLLWVEYCEQCRANGELLDAYLFVAVMPYSGYCLHRSFLGHETGFLDQGPFQCMSLLWRCDLDPDTGQSKNRCYKEYKRRNSYQQNVPRNG